jgi:fructokinase
MAARLGSHCSLIGKVGNDPFGRFLQDTLTGLNIDTSTLSVDPKIPTTLAVVQLDPQGDRSFSFYRKPGADIMLTPEEVPLRTIQACRTFHFGSLSLTDEPCRSATLHGVLTARKLGKRISFDPNYRPALWPSPAQARSEMERGAALCDILKVSEEEMTFLTGETNPESGSAALLSRGPSMILVSLGGKGAFFRTPSCYGSVPAYQVEVCDTTGAGDAFLGAFLHRTRELSPQQLNTLPQDTLADIVDFANAAAALTTTRGGAIPALPTPEEIDSCRKQGLYRTLQTL